MKTVFTRLTSAASLALLWIFLTLGVASRGVADALIIVSSTCSLAEAIQSANFDSNGTTGCTPGSGHDTIMLPAGQVLRFTRPYDDPYSPFGPAALPIVFSEITIEGNGARLEAAPVEGATFRAFSVGEASVPGPDGIVRQGNGDLHLKRLHIKNFAAKGGDGRCGGGGGMGAGGAVYAGPGSTLTIEKSTLEFNGAIGGDALFGCATFSSQGGPGGGGGGMGGNGGLPASTNAQGTAGAGGGGGGSRGNGSNAYLDRGGAGGGTLRSGGGTGPSDGGFRCGAGGTSPITWGDDAPCPGGGGAGAGQPRYLINVEGGRGGSGAYGGGGGGAGSTGTPAANSSLPYGEDGGSGGFGGGGGACAGVGGVLTSTVGGSSTFGGGGGACDEDTPSGFFFGGGGGTATGGSGAGLGGGVFGHAATVNIINSTLTGNYAVRGIVEGTCLPGETYCGSRGTDLGGAVFSFQGSLAILNSTIAGNENTGSYGGVVYLNINLSILGTPPPGFFTMRNTIVAHNGVNFSAPSECAIFAGNTTVTGSGNLILQNDTDGPCPGVVSTTDPELLPLRLNIPGLTPTMAILLTSSAADTADPATSLSSDQRGVDRPNNDGYDIGAYEARLPEFVIDEFEAISLDLGTTVTVPITVRSADNFTDPVTLEVDAGTTGLELSFDQRTVTPLPDQPASVTLTVRAGPTVVAGIHTVTLNFRSDALSRRVFTQVTVRATTEGMARTITAFRNLGQIVNAGIATALTSKLSATQQLINGGERQAAVNTLGALRFQIGALSGKQIVTSAASVLLANTDALIATVGPTLTPSPVVGTAVTAAGFPVANGTIDIVDATKSKIATVNTDVEGFYYVARTDKWTSGNKYTATIALPKGYKRATPSIQVFTWSKSLIRLPAFVLSK